MVPSELFRKLRRRPPRLAVAVVKATISLLLVFVLVFSSAFQHLESQPLAIPSVRFNVI